MDGGDGPAADSADFAIADARLRTADGRKDMWLAVFLCWLGTTMVIADFELFNFIYTFVFSHVSLDTWNLLHSVLRLVNFIAGTVGALLFAWLADRLGRKQVMVFTVTLMGVSTTMIGLIPPYEYIGLWAPVCLVLLRFAQALSAGAQLACGTVMLGEYAATGRRGLVSSVIALGSYVGALLAYVVWLAVEQMYHSIRLDWGWRIPFFWTFLGISSTVLAALWIRRNLRETPVFERHRALLRANRGDGAPAEFWLRSKSFWTMVGLCMGDNGSTNLNLMYLSEAARTVLSRKQTETELIAIVIICLAIPLAGWLSDRYGRRPVYRTINLLLIVYPWLAYALMDSSENSFMIVLVFMVDVTLSYASMGVRAAWGVELFGVRHRYTKIVVAEVLGKYVTIYVTALGLDTVYSMTGHWWSVALYTSVIYAVPFLTIFVAPETRGRNLNILGDAI